MGSIVKRKRVIKAVNFPTTTEADRAEKLSFKRTKRRRGFSVYVRQLIENDFNKNATA